MHTIRVRYTWDLNKAASNLAKHGVSFDRVEAFDWEVALVTASLKHAGGEPRLLAFSPIGNRLYALAYSIETRSVRVISLRRASNKEIIAYENQD